MNSLTLLNSALTLLVLTALGGVTMAVIRSKGSAIPNWLAMAHGFLAAAALTLLVFAAVNFGLPPLVWAGLGALAVAGAGGVYLNLRYQTGNLPLPMGLIIGHGGLAAVGVVVIAIALR